MTPTLAYELFYGNKLGMAISCLKSNPFSKSKLNSNNEDRWSEAFTFLLEKYSGRKMKDQLDLYRFIGNVYQRAYERETLTFQNTVFESASPIVETDEDGSEYISDDVYEALEDFYAPSDSHISIKDEVARERLKIGLKDILHPISDEDVTELSDRLTAFALGSNAEFKKERGSNPYINMGSAKDKKANRLRARMSAMVNSTTRSVKLRELISSSLS